MIYPFNCSERTRENTELTKEEKLKRFHLEKEWCVYSYKQYKALCVQINRATKFAAEALAELRKESEELYVQAIQVCTHVWKGSWNVMIELIEFFLIVSSNSFFMTWKLFIFKVHANFQENSWGWVFFFIKPDKFLLLVSNYFTFILKN